MSDLPDLPVPEFKFQIGNSEITNLIVQNHVTKVQLEIDSLQAQIDGINKTLKANEKKLQKGVQELATERWAAKVKELTLLLREFGFTNFDVPEGMSAEDAYDLFQFEVQYNREVIYATRSIDPWTQEQIDNPEPVIRVGYELRKSFVKDGSTWHTSIFLPLQERQGYERLPVVLTDDLRGLISESRKLHRDMMHLDEERDRLRNLIQDTTNIEKQVLAALTRNTLSQNPEMLEQVHSVVSLFEKGKPLLAVVADSEPAN